MTARERAENCYYDLPWDNEWNSEKESIGLIESALLEAEAEGWKRGMENAAKIAYDWPNAVGLTNELRAAIEKKEKA